MYRETQEKERDGGERESGRWSYGPRKRDRGRQKEEYAHACVCTRAHACVCTRTHVSVSGLLTEVIGITR